ncbi:MAG TPA: GNAT family N-acetyltransferase, partial [Bradyrhizobium sp.]|nr:GNAT family N-acetyltransferase [Bradyrhizobium sp.]
MNDSALAGERVEIYSRGDLANCLRWREAFAAERKDHRYYELVEDTLHPEFAYRYFVIKDGRGNVRAVQPFFILDQDLLAGTSPAIRGAAKQIRRLLPRWLHMRTLMVGCVAGEAHLDGGDETQWPLHARLLAAAIVDYARSSAVRLIVLKEFPQKYRSALESFLQAGFTRIP